MYHSITLIKLNGNRKKIACNKVTLKYEFDEQTKLQLKSLLKEIDRNQQSSYQNMTSEGKQKYIKFESDKEEKTLSFTGKVEKKEVQTELKDSPGKYVTRYLFECYDITTTPRSEVTDEMSAIWERDRRDARKILNLLSKNFTELDIVCDGQPNSKTSTYLIYARFD